MSKLGNGNAENGKFDNKIYKCVDFTIGCDTKLDPKVKMVGNAHVEKQQSKVKVDRSVDLTIGSNMKQDPKLIKVSDENDEASVKASGNASGKARGIRGGDASDFSVRYQYYKPTSPYEVRWGHRYLETLEAASKPKSALKHPNDERVSKPPVTFTNATIYYFDKEKISKRSITEGQDHYFTNFVPVDIYEQERNQRILNTTAFVLLSRFKNLPDPPQGTKEMEVPVDLVNVRDRAHIRRGCSCIEHCDPNLCECNLAGKQCEVLQDNFPCGCKLQYCKNSYGRKEYNYKCVTKNSEAAAKDPEKKIQRGKVNKCATRKSPRFRKF